MIIKGKPATWIKTNSRTVLRATPPSTITWTALLYYGKFT